MVGDTLAGGGIVIVGLGDVLTGSSRGFGETNLGSVFVILGDFNDLGGSSFGLENS